MARISAVLRAGVLALAVSKNISLAVPSDTFVRDIANVGSTYERDVQDGPLINRETPESGAYCDPRHVCWKNCDSGLPLIKGYCYIEVNLRCQKDSDCNDKAACYGSCIVEA